MNGELELSTMAMGMIGGLAFFLYGMEQMSAALKAIAGNGMRKLLGGLTKNRFLGAFTGAFITSVVQSSSVTTVLVVGFISAGLMSLSQSIGVIMGANIGTTITAQIVAFKVTKYAVVMIALGVAMVLMSKREKLRQSGIAIMGLGLIFFGMGMMSDATNPLRDFDPFINVMRSMDNPFLGMLAGAAFTALVQSSSATTGIVIVLASEGFISLEAGIALAFGANLGTCVTAALAALGKPTEARRAAAVHVLFNLIGVLVWLPFIDQLAEVVRAMSPTDPELEGNARLAQEVPRQIANAHTMFNVLNAAVLIWFTGLFSKLVTKLIPKKPIPLPEQARPLYLDIVYLETPALAVDRIWLEASHLGDLILEMVAALRGDKNKVRGSRFDRDRIEKLYTHVELLSHEILDYAQRLSEGNLTRTDSDRLQQVLNVVNQLRGIAETIATNLGALMHEWEERQLKSSEKTLEMFDEAYGKVDRAIQVAIVAGKERDRDKARSVIEMKKHISGSIDALSKHLGERLLSNDPNRADVYRLESRVLEIMRRLYYFAKRIAKVVAVDVLEEEVEKGDG